MINNTTINFVLYIFGLRNPHTSDTEKELSLLEKLASTSKVVVEVGVFEGIASARIAKCLRTDGCIYLVDPYFYGGRVERFFKFSMAEYIAHQQMKTHKGKFQFIRGTSVEAVKNKKLLKCCDLIFIDARHDYNSVLEDFQVWQPMVSDTGVIAFHDSRLCSARPDLNINHGPVKLLAEIEAGKHGNWRVTEIADSLSVVKRSIAS